MDDNNPPNRPYRIRRPSSSLISSTTSPVFPAPQPPPSPQGAPRPSTFRINNVRDIDEDIQPSSSTSSFGGFSRRLAQNNHNHLNHGSSSSSAGRSSSPLGSPDSTFWVPAPSPVHSSFSGSGNAGPPTPGGNCGVSSSTVDDVPASPFSPAQEPNNSGNLMLPPISAATTNPGASNAVSVISGSSNYPGNTAGNADSNDLPGQASPWEAVYGRNVTSSLSSLAGDSFLGSGSSFNSSLSIGTSSITSSSIGQQHHNESYGNSNVSGSMISAPIRSKIKKASSFERFSAQAQASSNISNSNNLSGNNSANLNGENEHFTAAATSTVTNVSNASSISNVQASTSAVTGAASSSRLLWDYVPSSASSAGSSALHYSSRLSSASAASGSLSSSLSESFIGTKPFHLKKFAAKIASVFEQEQHTESTSSLIQAINTQPQQSSSSINAIGDLSTKSNQDSGLSQPLPNQTHDREPRQIPLNLTEGMSSSCPTANISSSPPKGRNLTVMPTTKSFLTPKQKLLQRLQSGELFDSAPNSPPPALLPPLATATVPPVSQQSSIQQQHQILLSTLQQPPTLPQLNNSLHLPAQPEPLLEEDSTPTPPPPSPGTSPTPRASAELERYVNSMSISNYEAFIRASGDEFIVPDTLGKNVDSADLSNIQVLYDAADPYTYYYGNILVDEMDFAGTSSNVNPGTSATAGASTGNSSRQLLVMPPGSNLDDPSFTCQASQQGHGHLEFVLGLNSQEDQRQHELRDDDLQLGDLSHHQSFLDPNDTGISLALGKSTNESTLRNLLMMEPLRAHDDSWISTAASVAEYQNRLGLNQSGTGLRGMNLNSSAASTNVNSSSLNFSNSWINDWPSRGSSWQQSHHELADHEEQNEVMDMSILDMTDKGKRQGQAGGVCMDDVDLADNSTASGLSLITPMDLQQPLGLSLTTSKTSEISEPMDLQQHPHPLIHSHSNHHTNEDQENEEPVNLMAVVNLEHELTQAHVQHHQSQMELSQNQAQSSNYSSSMFSSTTAPPKVLSPPVIFNHNFDVLSQAENAEERKIILLKKSKEIERQQHCILMTNAPSPSNSSSASGNPGPQTTTVVLDKPVQPRSIASLPNLLNFARTGDDRWTVVTNRNKVIPPNTRFGPVEGPLRKVYQEDLDTADAVYPCLIMVDASNTFWQLDRNDDDLCNWMKFVRLAHSASSQNCLISEINGVLYFTTCKHIQPKAELQAGYDFDYAQRYGLQYFELSPSDSESLGPELMQDLDNTDTYVCVDCELDFSTPEEFNEHVESIHREPEIQPKKSASRNYPNPKAERSPAKKTKSTLDAPKVRNKKVVRTGHSLAGTILCKHCGGVYLTMTELKKHLKESEPCGRSGNIELLVLKSKQNMSALREKKAKAARCNTPISAPAKVKCQLCYKGFASNDRLDKHMLVHNEQFKPLKCNFCPKRYLTNSALAGHVRTHAEEGKCFECPMCSFGTQQLLSLKEHVQTHKNSENGLFYCPHCTKKFKIYAMVRKHIRAFHGPRLHNCDHCPMTFPTLDKLKLHVLKHSDHKEFLCAECGRQFKRKDKLREHTKRLHENRKRPEIVTPEVFLNVPSKRLLKKFSSRVNQEEFSRYVYKCMDCLLGFKRRGMLVNHLAKRHPEKPPQQVPELNLPILKTSRNYFCPYCDRIYKSSSKRKSHILKSHPGKQIPPQLRGKGAPSKQKSTKADNQAVSTSTIALDSTSESQLPVVSTTTTSVDDNGVSGNVIVSRREPIISSPHGCQWCHRQYASRAKLLQHQRKSHLHLMPPEIQIPRAQKNNVGRSSESAGIITVSVTDVAPIHSQALEMVNSSSEMYSTINTEMLGISNGNHSIKLQNHGTPERSVIGYLLTTTTVTNGNFENAMEPEIVVVTQQVPHTTSSQSSSLAVSKPN